MSLHNDSSDFPDKASDFFEEIHHTDFFAELEQSSDPETDTPIPEESRGLSQDQVHKLSDDLNQPPKELD